MDRYTKGFILASLVYFLAAAVLGVWIGAADAGGWVRFVHVHFNLLGFMSMMIYGVGYFILPRFNGRTLRWPSLVAAHFYAANIGLIGMAAAYPGRPSAVFVLFSSLSVLSAAMFVANLGATMLLDPAKAPEKERETAGTPTREVSGGTAAAAPRVEIDPDMRVGEILTRWPETAEAFVAGGFTSLRNPEHREQVKQLPITLRMACQRHNIDIEAMVARLTAAAGGSPVLTTARTGGLARGKQIRADDILGDILAVYPETEKVFRKYYGDGCFSCPGQTTESVTQSALMHNVDEKGFLEELNRAAGF
jgi:hypothetical protein